MTRSIQAFSEMQNRKREKSSSQVSKMDFRGLRPTFVITHALPKRRFYVLVYTHTVPRMGIFVFFFPADKPSLNKVPLTSEEGA